MDLRGRRGRCADCEWHLKKEEWCLAKGTVVLRPTEEHPCRFYYLKRENNTTNTIDILKGNKE